MTYHTLFNVRVGRFHVYGDMDAYISFGVTVGLHMLRVEIGLWGFGIVW